MKLLALVGSLRKDSYNMQLAKSIQKRYNDQFDLDIADLRVLPYYDQDAELDAPESVQVFKKQVSDADGIIIITPEYNWSIPGVLKNALDWLSRVDKVMINKPVMTAGVSPATFGTLRAQLHLREVLSSPGIMAKVLIPAGNEVLINFAGEKFKEGELVHDVTLEFLDGVMNKFMKLIKGE